MAAHYKRPRRGSATDEMMKLHRRTMVLDGRVYTVISLRPGSDFRFSTNRFHETWHVLSDWRGARVLSRLLWGLAYQRRPGTLVVIDPEHLDPNPFDAAPADPIVLVPSELTVFTRGAGQEVDLAAVRAAFEQPEIMIHAELGLGDAAAEAWGCDLSEEYVRINADYTT